VDAFAIAVSALGWLGGVLAPGLAVAFALGLGRGPLERIAIAAPIGRVAFALVTLACVGSGRSIWLFGWPFLGAVALAAACWIGRRRPPGGRAPEASGIGVGAAASAAALAALLLVGAVVGRSGTEDATGALTFRGRDSTDDPVVYASAALRLVHSGLPLEHPFAAGAPATGQYVPLAALAGLHAATAAPMLELAFRVVPALDAATAALAAVAVALALGATPAGAGAAGALLALGGGAAFAVPWLGALVGRAAQALDTWAFFGPYLLAFNPIAPALGALFAAFLLLLAPDTSGRRTRAVVAGLLVASLFETKLFLWAPALAGLAATALLRPPDALARPLRLAAASALAGSLPSLVEKALAARRAAGVAGIGFELCPGCLPRYLLDASLGSRDLSFALFKGFRLADLASPRVALGAVAATALVLALGLGARWIALPELVRAFRAAPPAGGPATSVEVRATLQWIAFGSAAALAAGFGVVVTPHYLNGAQFAWFATFGLWPVAALPLGRWLARRSLAPVVLVAALALPSGIDAVLRLGLAAPLRTSVRPDERELCDALARLSAPDDAVLEPSILADGDRPSPIPFLAGRAVRLSLISTVQSLSAPERERRFEQVLAVFAGDDAAAARRALAESDARFVVVPFGWRPRVELAAFLEPVWRGPGGAIWRAPPPPAP
jgi:hypothetical protein